MKTLETESIEHKQSLSDWKSIVESVAAFATSSGGTVIVGISPEGETLGISIGKGAIEDLANKIKQNTNPVQLPSVNIIKKDEKALIEIKVMPCPIKPVMAFGRPFKRVGNTNQRLNHSEFKTLSLSNQNITWDAIECTQMRFEDIDRKAIGDYLKASGLQGSPNVVLKNLNLISNGGVLLNAAALLFAKKPTKYFVQSILKCGRFAGTQAIDFIDQKEFESGIIDQIERAISFVREHTTQAIEFTGAPQHKVVSQYPEKAVREAIVNALCHRDYTSFANTQVRIFDDRLEVWNPGNLPQSLTINKLKGKHESVPKNPKIAYALHRAGFAEQWGTGTNRMIDECKEHGIEVSFEADQHRFVVTFTPQLKTPLPPKKHEERAQRIPALDELQKLILAYVKKHGVITRRELQDLQPMDARKANRELAKLVQLAVLKKEGVGKSTVYTLH